MGGHKSSKFVKMWVKNAFDEWWWFCGYKTNISITNLSDKEDRVKGLVDMLCLFVSQVIKKHDNMYFPTRFFFLDLTFFFNFFCFFCF